MRRTLSLRPATLAFALLGAPSLAGSALPVERFFDA